MRVFDKIREYIDLDELLEKKLLNIFLISAFIFSACSVIASFILHADKTVIVVVSICIALIPFCYVLANDLKQPQFAAILTVILTMILFVPMFFYSGGLRCGMPLWFLMALLLPWMLVRGKTSVVLFIVIFIVETAAILLSVFYPDFVHDIGDELKIALDVIQSLFFIGSILSSIYVFQKSNYENKNQKLEYAYKEVKEATEAKSIFLSNMSHDIRTPMNAIIGFSTLAKKDSGNKKNVDDCLDKILTSGNYLLSLINDVLDMSKIERGEISLNYTRVNLKRLITDISIMLEYQIKSNDLELVVDVSQIKHNHIETDIIKLRKIIVNILSNSIKYTRDESKKIWLTVSEKEIGNNHSKFSFVIKDEGKGMSEEFMQKMFIPFERESNTTVSGIVGTGLGLAITKSAVECLGGSIDVQSKVGEGSEFTVNLDCKYFETAGNDSDDSYDSVTFQGKKVLLVEDNELNLEIATRLLKEFGFIVDTAKNGMEAYHAVMKCREEVYDLIYMDVMMPVCNGYEATEKIRSIPNLKKSRIPIIAMTANAFEDDIKKAIECGMDGYIIKPLAIEEIVKETKRVLVVN